VPELIRMMLDSELNQAPGGSRWVWASLHAWRALAELQAREAVPHFLELLNWADDDWMTSDIGGFFCRMGPEILPVAGEFLGDRSKKMWPRGAVAEGISALGRKFLAYREPCIQLLCDGLKQASENEPEYNGLLVAALLDLEAVEAAPILEQAFATGNVDETIAGDWDHVQWDLGLSDRPPEQPALDSPLPGWIRSVGGTDTRTAKQKRKAKDKRKAARASRKRNRKNG
jgi:hypothetical protein